MPLSSDVNALELHDQLASLGTDLLHVEFMDYLRGNLVPIPQSSRELLYKKIQKTECGINWNESARRIHNKVRGFYSVLVAQLCFKESASKFIEPNSRI